MTRSTQHSPLVISPIKSGHENEASGSPPVYPVGGLGEIVKHTKLPDGRFLITLAGLARVRIGEVPSDEPYRKVEFEALEEIQPGSAEETLPGGARARGRAPGRALARVPGGVVPRRRAVPRRLLGPGGRQASCEPERGVQV